MELIYGSVFMSQTVTKLQKKLENETLYYIAINKSYKTECM